jgi:hypothetical protein
LIEYISLLIEVSMVHNAEELLAFTCHYEVAAHEALMAVAEGKCNCESSHCPHGEEACHNKAGKRKAQYVGALCDECADRMPEKYMKKDAAKDKKKLDPKAKVRSRGKCVFPAEKSKDKKDHYPINNIDQARAALRYAGKQKSAPWYHGSVESMRKAVERAVHSAFPELKKDKKKSSSIEVSETLVAKYS